VLDGEITLSFKGTSQTYRAGDVFTMAAGCEHAEQCGPAGVTYTVGRRHQTAGWRTIDVSFPAAGQIALQTFLARDQGAERQLPLAPHRGGEQMIGFALLPMICNPSGMAWLPRTVKGENFSRFKRRCNDRRLGLQVSMDMVYTWVSWFRCKLSSAMRWWQK
jgi:hypothetical protein